MKISIVSPAHPLRGGIASSSERLAKALQDQGHKVDMISFKLQYPGFLFPGKTQYTTDVAPEELNISPQINSINPFNWIKVGRRIRRSSYDLIIVRYWLPFMGPALGTILRLGKKTTKSKIIAITDNIIPHEKRPGDRIFTSYFLKATDACIVMSKSVETDIRSFDAEKPVRFIPHPIYDNYGNAVSREKALKFLNLDVSSRYILFFGFIRAYKGLDLLLRAFAHEKIQKSKINLLVAGEFYGNEASYRALIDQLKITDRVKSFNTYIPNEEVKYYFSAADLVAQPYKTATQSGISQLAYHFEKPMLVTNVGGLPEIVSHRNAGYVVPVEEKAIAQALIDYFESDKQTKMTNFVRQEKQKFSWDNMVQGIEALCSELR